MTKPKPISAYQKIRAELIKAFQKGCREVNVDDLSYLTDKDHCEVRMLTRYVIRSLADNEGISYFRKWAKGEGGRTFIRAYKASNGSEEDKAEMRFDLDHDKNQVEGRSQVLSKLADCAKKNQILTSYGVKKYKFIPMGKSRLLGSPEDKSKKPKKTS